MKGIPRKVQAFVLAAARLGVKKRIKELRVELATLEGLFGDEPDVADHKSEPWRRKMTPAKEAAIRKALAARWAGHKARGGKVSPLGPVTEVIYSALTLVPQTPRELRRKLPEKFWNQLTSTLARLRKQGRAVRHGKGGRDGAYALAKPNGAGDQRAMTFPKARGTADVGLMEMVEPMLPHENGTITASQVKAALDEKGYVPRRGANSMSNARAALNRLVARGKAMRPAPGHYRAV